MQVCKPPIPAQPPGQWHNISPQPSNLLQGTSSTDASCRDRKAEGHLLPNQLGKFHGHICPRSRPHAGQQTLLEQQPPLWTHKHPPREVIPGVIPPSSSRCQKQLLCLWPGRCHPCSTGNAQAREAAQHCPSSQLGLLIPPSAPCWETLTG